MQPRPRVLAVAQSAELGGAERALLRIAERLPELGFDVEIAMPRRSPHASVRLPVGPIQRGRWPAALAGWPAARWVARRADVVLLNGVVTQRLAPAMTAATVVPYIHELVESKPRAWRSARFWQATPVVMCACDAVAQHCRSLGVPADRLRTVYAPVDAVPASAEPEWARRGAVVGFVGRIEPHKGLLDLARAMQSVAARLVVVGEGGGAYAESVRAAAPDALFLGAVDDARPLMPWFDVLAVPSYTEAFGTVAAEALAAGTPVVAARGTGMEEYVEPAQNGELVIAGDVDALAEAIRRLLPRAASMADAARASVAAFASERVAAGVAAALREALSSR